MNTLKSPLKLSSTRLPSGAPVYDGNVSKPVPNNKCGTVVRQEVKCFKAILNVIHLQQWEDKSKIVSVYTA